MTTKYFALLTNQGAAKLANAAALGTKVNITQMAVGDGGGALPTPDPAQTKLIGEKRRASLNSLTIDAAKGSQIIAEQIIPEGEGGFWIREIGLFDADGVMIAVANCAETYKPQLAEGSGRTQTVRMIIIVNSTSAVTLKIDPSVVLATRKYVDDGVIVAKQYADTLQAQAKEYADTLLEQAKKYSGDALKAHTDDTNPHQQYLRTAQALAEIKAAGKVADALKSLGVGEGAPLIGSPFPWPHAQMPNEIFDSMSDMVFLKSNGASFSATLYPKLAQLYPGLKLTDLRGEFIRGLDDGRGVDSNRALLSNQGDAIRNLTGNLMGANYYAYRGLSSGVFYDAALPAGTILTAQSGSQAGNYSMMDASRQVPTAAENRPRNVAFNYLVRAK